MRDSTLHNCYIIIIIAQGIVLSCARQLEHVASPKILQQKPMNNEAGRSASLRKKNSKTIESHEDVHFIKICHAGGEMIKTPGIAGST